MHTEIELMDGVPDRIKTYTDSTKTTMAYDIHLQWSNGVLRQILINDFSTQSVAQPLEVHLGLQGTSSQAHYT
jgi:hypothetical protein